MKKMMLMMMALVLLACFAQAFNAAVTTTLNDGSLSVTNSQTYARLGNSVEYVAVVNDAAFSNTVTVTATALGVTVGTLYSGTLTAGASAVVYPVRTVSNGLTTNRCYIVRDISITVTSASGVTNSVDGSVRVFLQSPED